MSLYLLSTHSVEGESREPISADDMQRQMDGITALEAEMSSAGALVLSGRLTAPTDAKVVRHRNGKLLSTDGPFVEAKEQIGGFYIVEAPNSEAALEWAAKTSAVIGRPIEVRPFAGHRSG